MALREPTAMCDLQGRLRLAHERLARGPSSLGATGLRDELEFEIPSRLLKALASSRGETKKPSVRLRRRALERARGYIEEFADEPPTVRDLRRVAEVSERTLQYAFLEHFGVTPKSYLQAVRLNGVRRALRNSDSSVVKVPDVANRWGFWQVGQCAADYRKTFGELPSESL